jgi:glycosyltransferase involved in cell wall biosynthesis
MKISLIQPGRNNLKYLKWSYDSIRKNQGDHEVEICVADDFSSDGTREWCNEMVEKDPNFKWIRNHGPTRKGHTILYDRLVNEVATHDVCMIFHADMYLCPGALDAIEKHMYGTPEEPVVESRIVSLTRIEPPLHPPGPEKILQDFGIEPEEFDEDGLLEHVKLYQPNLATTEGIFAPWAFWKNDFQEIGGHDPLFAPQSKEDSDIFNRFQLNGVKFVQTWEGFVYHMTCRGSRFADGATRNPDGQVFMKNRETDEWLTQNQKSTRNFIRKWGHFVKHDQYLKPIIPSKYNIGFIVTNCEPSLLEALEPWCSTIYSDGDFISYIEREKINTSYDLYDRVRILESPRANDIYVNIDNNIMTQEDFQYIQQLSEILQESTILEDDYGCEFEVGNLHITVNNMKTYENDLIINKKKEDKE